MNSYFKIYKIISFVLLVIDILLGVYLIISTALALRRCIVMPSFNLAIFLTLISVNLVYLIFTLSVFLINKKKS